jgi:hypothetical protein
VKGVDRFAANARITQNKNPGDRLLFQLGFIYPFASGSIASLRFTKEFFLSSADGRDLDWGFTLWRCKGISARN